MVGLQPCQPLLHSRSLEIKPKNRTVCENAVTKALYEGDIEWPLKAFASIRAVRLLLHKQR